MQIVYGAPSQEERALVQDKLEYWYALFLKRVASGRKMSVERAHALDQGRIWSGDAALEQGLIDHLGGYLAALRRARQLAHLPANAEVLVAPRRPETLLDYVLSSSAQSANQAIRPALAGLRQVAQQALTLSYTQAGMPMALMPYTLTPP